MSSIRSLLIILALVCSACQPVQPAMESAIEEAGVARTVNGEIDFSNEEWGITGWLHFDAAEIDPDTNKAAGSVRWVEYDLDNELRYVTADAHCISFGEDGKSAVLSVQIVDKLGWGDGEPGQWLNFWLHDGGSPGATVDTFSTTFWPPVDAEPGCAYVSPEYEVLAAGGDLVFRGEPSQPKASARAIKGGFGFPSPAEWGVDLWIAQEFDVHELNSATHEAEGSLSWGVYNIEDRVWKRVQSNVEYVVFDDDGKSAMVVAKIVDKTGPGEGEPGEYACFWVSNGTTGDQFGIHYYSDFHPDAGFKEFWPANEMPPLEVRSAQQGYRH